MRRSRLTREQIVSLRAGQSVLIVLASSPHSGSWGHIRKAYVPNGGRRVFEIEDHRGSQLFVGIESIVEIGRSINTAQA